MVGYFIAILVFPISENPYVPNSKAKGQIGNFRKNRRLDPQVDVVEFFFVLDSR